MKRIVIVAGIFFMAVLVLSSVAARKHRWYSNQSNTYGWEIMSPEEQRQYHMEMQSLSGFDACLDFMAKHNQKMEQRATEKGVVLPAIQYNPCEIMKNRKMFR